MTTFLQSSFDGLALGSLYALIAIGFVTIYRATGILNFAQGGSMLLGAYLTYNATTTWGWSYWLALAFSVVAVAGFSVLLQRAMLQRVLREVFGIALGLLTWAALVYNDWTHGPALAVGAIVGVGVAFAVAAIESRMATTGPRELPGFSAIMITLGVLLVIKQIVPSIWGFVELPVNDPWEIGASKVGGLVFGHSKLATLAMAGLALSFFFVVDRYTKIGLAMRAVHSDHEAAMAHGISTKTAFAAAFGIAGAAAALAGSAAVAGSALLNPNLDLIVFLAFPAIILGGFDSPLGAVVGGLVIGWFQNLVSTHLSSPPSWFPLDNLDEVLGTGFDRVAVFAFMIVVLMVRPYGLFGTKEVRRI